MARELEDNVLLDDARRTLAAGGRILRLRRTASGAVLTFKGPRRVVGGLKSREELETPASEPDALAAILEQVGLRPVFRYQKYRETWAWKRVEIVLDETPVGVFFEIEGEPRGVHAAAAALGFTPADYVSASYLELFFAAGGRGDMVFE